MRRRKNKNQSLNHETFDIPTEMPVIGDESSDSSSSEDEEQILSTSKKKNSKGKNNKYLEKTKTGLMRIKMVHKAKKQHKSHFIPDGNLFCSITGSSGTGKSTFLLTLVPMLSDDIRHYVICTRIVGNPVNQAIKAWAKSDGKTVEIVHEIKDAETIIEDLVNERVNPEEIKSHDRSGAPIRPDFVGTRPVAPGTNTKNSSNEKNDRSGAPIRPDKVGTNEKKINKSEQSDKSDTGGSKGGRSPPSDVCIISDDFTNYSGSREDRYNKFTNKAFSMLRNYGCHFVIITQSYANLHPQTRNNITLRVCFPMRDIKSIKELSKDLYSIYSERIVDSTIPLLMNKIGEEDFQFLLMKSVPPSIYIGFGEKPVMEKKGGKLIADDLINDVLTPHRHTYCSQRSQAGPADLDQSEHLGTGPQEKNEAIPITKMPQPIIHDSIHTNRHLHPMVLLRRKLIEFRNTVNSAKKYGINKDVSWLSSDIVDIMNSILDDDVADEDEIQTLLNKLGLCDSFGF